MSHEIHTEREGALLRQTLDRPPLNVLTTSMIEELAVLLREADRDDHRGAAPRGAPRRR